MKVVKSYTTVKKGKVIVISGNVLSTCMTSENTFVVNNVMIDENSNFMTPPFLLAFDIFNMNVNNCLSDSSDSSNVMPYVVCKKLNLDPQRLATQVVQLDHLNVKVMGEMKDIIIKISSNLKLH